MSVEPPKKRNKRAESGSQNRALEAFEKLRLVLGQNYFNVCQRLALDYVPSCVRNIGECATHHANKRGPRTRCISSMRQSNALEQIVEQRPGHFVELIHHALIRREFIEANLFVAGLQLILTINEPSQELDVDYDVTTVLNGTIDVLEKSLDRFPPCRWDLRTVYNDVIFGHLAAPCFSKCDQREGLVKNVLHLLEQYIDQKPPEERKKRGVRKDGPAADVCATYSSWYLNNQQKYNIDLLPREDRFRRLFMVLQLLVKILEMDLAMWILRNPLKARQNLCHPSHCPLVAQLVWNGDTGSVNLFIRKLFQMFINMTALEYPDEDIVILARLLNLVLVAVNVSEFQHNEGMIQYPCLKKNSNYFAKQLWSTIELSAYYSVRLCLNTIRHVRAPFLKLSLTEHLIRKLQGPVHPMNVQGFFQHLLDRNWEECGDEVPSDSSSSRDGPVYPVFDRHKKRTRSSEISSQQYVDLLYGGFRAYCDMYQIASYFRELTVKPDQHSDSPEKPSPTKAASAHSIGGSSRTQIECFPHDTRIVTRQNIGERIIFHEVEVNEALLLAYREDIKHLLLIGQQLKQLQTAKERGLFHNWINFLSKVDPSLYDVDPSE
ncbi:uncharacterized protein LOC128266907 [Anopheles cruzii]|uniref:uncharacterized protein LOC128266907 n=1 Tax=Anopheles cruzii TaxID=68878 RepID=UPI0022EC34FF|nr:uncharacterized protein LOC128266907 [Anopheles cruzii]